MRGTAYIATSFVAPSTTSPLRNLLLTINRGQPIGNGRYHRESKAITSQTREWRKLGRTCKRDQNRSVGEGSKTICRHEPLVSLAPFASRHPNLRGLNTFSVGITRYL